MTEQKVALIIGITGKDGSFLGEFLLKKGYIVHGIKRRTSLFNTDRIDHLYFNTDKPDGTMKKLTDVSKLHALGWKHSIELVQGISTMYKWYISKKGKN